jgi:hypothetical protein
VLVAAGTERDTDDLISISAHDFAYTACCVGGIEGCDPCLEVTAAQGGEPRQLHLLYVARGDGNQVIAFEMDRDTMQLDLQKDYLPLRRWQAKALVAVGGKIWYDFTGRWVPLQIFVDCRYARHGALATPPPQEFAADEPHGQQFDSRHGAVCACSRHRRSRAAPRHALADAARALPALWRL